MQEAMLVHSLAASGSGVNFEQSCMRIVGTLDLEAFRHAWATVFERHDVLRTAFHWRGLARPLQVVQHQVPLRSEARLGGTECVSTRISRWWAYDYKQTPI